MTMHRCKTRKTSFINYRRIIDENVGIIFPRKYVNYGGIKPITYKVCIVKETEEGDEFRVLRDKMGRTYTEKPLGDWTIIDDHPYEFEETFWMFGKDPVKNRVKINDILLIDSGGQYKYGTTDVTRTICFSKQKTNIKNIFTKVLKGHIAVAMTNLNKDNTGKKIDKRARKFLKKDNLDYAHGTGHGVGFFLNVHEGPQSISKFNKVKIKEGMILSNEPGYYKKNQFGIRIENLIYVKKFKNKLFFENLTLAPIEKDLINFKLLTLSEKNYLFQYHLKVYSQISKYLNSKEKKWLANFINHF